ncbi:MAG: Hsp20/alpha crystallin family protein [Thermoproteota archaeon]
MWRRRRILDEFEAIERELDQLIDEFLYGRPMWNPQLECLEPLAYMQETDEKIVVTIDLPFVRKEDIKLDITPNELTVEAQMQKHVAYDRWGTVQRQCRFKTFHKTLKLPVEVVPEMVKAKFKEGYLTIELPKKTRRFKVKVE